MAESNPSKLDRAKNALMELNEDISNLVTNAKPTKYTDGWSEDNWEEEMQKHPLFMKESPKDQELSPLLEALQQLKYDPEENSAEELAKNYKDDGNENFKLKKYRFAVDSYTEGLKQKCRNSELNTQLFSNRAAAHYHLGNFRSSLKDSVAATTLNPDHMKSILRGAQCCFELKLFEDCISWCLNGLSLDGGNTQLKSLHVKAQKEKEIQESNKKKAELQEMLRKSEEDCLLKAIKERDINLGTVSEIDDDATNKLEGDHLGIIMSKVHLNNSNELVWPVIFLYPEFGQSDIIQNFNENTSILNHLYEIFDPENKPEWDPAGNYTPETVQVYYTNFYTGGVVSVDKTGSLRSIICDKRYKVLDGTPTFFITVKNSAFDEGFRRSMGGKS